MHNRLLHHIIKHVVFCFFFEYSLKETQLLLGMRHVEPKNRCNNEPNGNEQPLTNCLEFPIQLSIAGGWWGATKRVLREEGGAVLTALKPFFMCFE